jgi:pre-mRNA-splicing factor CWC22
LDVFQFDKDYEENEKKWNVIKAEILGETVNPNNPEEQQEEEDEELNAELQKQEENKNVFIILNLKINYIFFLI